LKRPLEKLEICSHLSIDGRREGPSNAGSGHDGGPANVASEGEHDMRAFDLSPLYRSTVGFDRLFSMLDQATGGGDSSTSYPPYNIEKTGDNDYRISIAVAGFEQGELAIEVKEHMLLVRGEHVAKDGAEGQYLFRGIAARNFERRFQLADHVTVTGASLVNGLLHIDLVREVPEAAKPRHIPIGGGESAAPQVIEGGKAKAPKAEPRKIAA
jgi:molecular chaperone IbpA